MRTIRAYLQLARPLNLLMICLTQLLFWYYIVEPVYAFFQLEAAMNNWQVIGIITCTVLIAAGGYVINDYYDLPIDLVNKEDRVIISRELSDGAAFNYYLVLTAVGLVSALAVAWSLGQPTLILLPFFIASMMWFYAQQFKRMFLVGNLVVGLSIVAVIFILILFEVDWKTNAVELHPATNEILKFGLAYMVFSFLMTMLREVVKDLQDMEGDARFECRTIPIVWGERGGKIVSGFWLGITLAAIAWLVYELSLAGNYPALVYCILFLLLPGLYCLYKIIIAKNSSDYRTISNVIKLMMIFGTLTMIYIGIILGKHG